MHSSVLAFNKHFGSNDRVTVSHLLLSLASFCITDECQEEPFQMLSSFLKTVSIQENERKL